MYRVKFIYAPYPTKYFRKKQEALNFKKSKVAASKLEKKQIFGKWKEVK